MSDEDNQGSTRRGVLECMVWAGAGLLWTMNGGVPNSTLLLGPGAAQAAESTGFSFLQISDSHVGFKHPENPDALKTLGEAIDHANALTVRPALMIHTGDVTHLSKPEQFDQADSQIARAKLDAHLVPGEHDVIDEGIGKLWIDRYGKRLGAKGTGWYSFDQSGVHFIGLVNVANLVAGGMGRLGDDQLKWLAADLKGKSASTPIVAFAHIPLWTIYAEWGWGTSDSAQALALLKRFGSVTVLNGHIHQIIQKVEGHMAFHTALSTAFPQPAPGTAPSPGPMMVPEEKLRTMLGITSVTVRQGDGPLAITDRPLKT